MENKLIARKLRMLSQLMELYEENPFKVKSLASAAYTIDKLPFPVAKKSLAEMEKIPGIGKSTATKIWELLENQSISELDMLVQQTPPGIVEMLGIKGIGPKKLKTIWKELGVENIGELYYACNENRLAEASGFGLKTQEDIKKVIEFKMAGEGQILYAQAEVVAEDFLRVLKTIWPAESISYAGAYRRRCEILNKIDFLIAAGLSAENLQKLESIPALIIKSHSENNLEVESGSGVKISLNFCTPGDFAWQLIEHTGNESHVAELKGRFNGNVPKAASENDIYSSLKLGFIEPELREGQQEFGMAASGKTSDLITFSDLKGALHNHSTWSDGVHSLDEMILFCRDELSLEYLGICDHSKSAFYANGLTEERVLAQHQEIDILNQKYAPFKVFKGIESDILFDGSLDYPPEILVTFDFIVASVHSILKMTEEKATSRLIRAIENPYTTILGHPTGRLLLSRSGYPIDHKKIIDACASNGVVIEINSNPLRLDLDWRWHQYAIEKGVMLSINPDAHRNDGLYDMHFGVLVARKGGITAKNCLNALNIEELDHYFERRKSGLFS